MYSKAFSANVCLCYVFLNHTSRRLNHKEVELRAVNIQVLFTDLRRISMH